MNLTPRTAMKGAKPQAPQDLVAGDHVGRFKLVRVLGQGGQSVVWLAHDPRLEREVALKVMRPAALDGSGGVDRWLTEARHVGHLGHPHIVPIYEADVAQGRPYLVFEYVPGRVLSEHLRVRGTLPAHEAVGLMLGVLDALSAAHEAGVIHRDLKPSNILIDGAGRARVMDFGIAVRIKDQVPLGDIVGTLGYLSPEAAQGLPPTPRVDVFAAGLILAEMLCGHRLIADAGAHQALHRLVNEDLSLPTPLGADVDDGLRAILMRSLAKNPDLRYVSAKDFHEALQRWAQAGSMVEVATGVSGTLAFLLRRMRYKSDFPALSDSVTRIQRLVNSEHETLANLTAEILKDVALTNKLLRLVNTVHYKNAGGGAISTVSRAVALVGFSGIRNLALSLVLLDHMHDKAHAKHLLDEFLGALMTASVASALTPSARHTEEAFIGGMFHNLGRLLAIYYLPEEAQQIRNGLAASQGGANEEAVAIGVLGLSYEGLGMGIAKSWGMPEVLLACMKKPLGPPPSRQATRLEEHMHWAVVMGGEVSDLFRQSTPAQIPPRLQALVERYGRVLGVGGAEIQAAVLLARQKVVQMAQAMNLPLSAWSAQAWGDEISNPSAGDASAQPQLSVIDTVVMAAAVPTSGPTQEQAVEMLLSGIQDITNSMVESFKLNEILRMILETMIRALNFRRVIFCLRDHKQDCLTGRFGLGEEAATLAKHFKIPLKAGVDLFSAISIKGADTLIADATPEHIARTLPAWFRQSVNAPSFLVLPLHAKGAPLALIYADVPTPGGLVLGEKEMSLLRTLRNQAVLAFMQSG